MNAKELAKLLEVVVRKVVREELKPILNEVKKNNNKPVINETVVKKEKDPLDVSHILEAERKKNPAPSKFSNNKMLNKLLSETYDDGEWKNMDGNIYTSNQSQGFNRTLMAEKLGYGTSANSMAPDVDPEGRPVSVDLEGTAVGAALTKDYSALMKSINAKKGK